MTSPEVAVMEVGLKLLPLAPTTTVCDAARTREAVRRAIAARASILKGRGREREVGSRKEGKIGAIVYSTIGIYTPMPTTGPLPDFATCIVLDSDLGAAWRLIFNLPGATTLLDHTLG
jgi:uncharacterized protein YqgC (DUF456 family)